MVKLNLEYKVPKRLTFRSGNPKTDKNKKLDKVVYYELKKTYIKLNDCLILRYNGMPYNLSGYQMCPSASAGCSASCLHTAGNPVFQKQKDLGRINRSRYYMQDRPNHNKQLIREIHNHELYCIKNGFIPVVRLNTTTDIPWEIHDIFELFPNVQFYDYTKIKKRIFKYLNNEYSKNYHLTFSMHETNYDDCIEVLNNGGNVAMVFRNQLPETYKGFQVVNGDESDLRFLDPRNSIVGLKAKGKAKKDTTGFVVNS